MTIKCAVILMLSFLAGCATLKEDKPLNADRITQAFFHHWQRADHQQAYTLLGKGISQRISFDQFDSLMKAIRQEWGRIESHQTAVMPFHNRAGEDNFIPLHAQPEEIKRYIFNIKFENAQMNVDLTLAPEEGINKIVWFSIWGSNIHLTPQIEEKIAELFAN